MTDSKDAKNLRGKLLETTAQVFETYLRGHRSAKGYAGGNSSGDLLYDLVKLNAQQFNDLASAGIKHAEYSRGILSALYDGFVSGAYGYRPGGVSGEEILLSGKLKKRVTSSLVAVNRAEAKRKLSFKVTRFRDLETNEDFDHEVAVTGEAFTLGPKVSKVFKVKTTLSPPKFVKGRAYLSFIEISHDGKLCETRALRVEVEP